MKKYLGKKSSMIFAVSLIALVISMLLVSGSHPATVLAARTASWVSSTNSNRWVQQSNQTFTAYDGTNTQLIDIDPNTTYQVIDGFGGCFNELGWNALNTLTATARDAVMKDLFDPNTGCKFNICRMPIGASDYGSSWYSLNDTSGDYSMTNFNITRDKGCLIQYIKAAMTYKTDLKVWGSAWSPPAWMKDNNNYAGGHLTWTAQNLTSYALYLEKYVQAYRAEGVNVYAVHVQNEPYANQVFPSCLWDGSQMRDFIKSYLGPKFQADSLNCEIWLGTINNGDYNACAAVVLGDSVANSYTTGCGYQWAGKDAIQPTHDNYPAKKLMQTETECGGGSNDWAYAESTFGLFKHYLDRWANSYMQWNMVLDETGNSTWGWKQCAMVTVNKSTHVVTYNPQFHLVKHFSYFITPGAYRVNSTGDWADKIAFKNPNGDLVLVVANRTDTSYTTTIKVGSEMIKPVIAARSFNTFVIGPSGGATPTPLPTVTPTPTAPPVSAFSQIEAENFNSQSGIQTESCSEGGLNVGYIENGDYMVYNNVNFGSGATGFDARVSSNTSGGNIEVRLDSLTGALVGTCSVQSTGGWQTWVTKSCGISGASGMHNLYLKFTGGTGYLLNINWFKFTASGATATPTPTPSPTPTPTPTPAGTSTPTPTPVSGSDSFNSSTLGSQWSWVRQDNTHWSLTAASGYMRITTQYGDIWTTYADAKNILLQNISGDWTISTKVTFSAKPSVNWQQAGLIVYQDDNNYLKISRVYNNGNEIQLGKEIGGSYSDQKGTDNISGTTIYFKITKSGSNYSAYMSSDGTTYTQVGTTQSITFSSVKVGLIAINGWATVGEVNADFDYFNVN
jgi:glucosylceramidase